MKPVPPRRRVPKKDRPQTAPSVPVERCVAVSICKFANGRQCSCDERGGALCETVMGLANSICRQVRADMDAQAGEVGRR